MRLALLIAFAAASAGCASTEDEGDRLARRYDDDTPLTTLSFYRWNPKAEVDLTAGTIDATSDRTQHEETLGGRAEAHLDLVSVLLEGFWVHANADAMGVKGDARYGRLDFAAAMRIVGPESAPPAHRPFPIAVYVDGIAGIRSHYGSLKADVSAFEREDQSGFWIEPMAGGRASVVLLRRITLEGRADISGIGYDGWYSVSTGAEANLRVDLAVGLGAFVGARWARVRVEEDDDDDGFEEFSLDLRLEGVQAGVLWEF